MAFIMTSLICGHFQVKHCKKLKHFQYHRQVYKYTFGGENTHKDTTPRAHKQYDNFVGRFQYYPQQWSMQQTRSTKFLFSSFSLGDNPFTRRGVNVARICRKRRNTTVVSDINQRHLSNLMKVLKKWVKNTRKFLLSCRLE